MIATRNFLDIPLAAWTKLRSFRKQLLGCSFLLSTFCNTGSSIKFRTCHASMLRLDVERVSKIPFKDVSGAKKLALGYL
jgi:hypothetical protein